MDALLRSNRAPVPNEATIISTMIGFERDSVNTLDARIHKFEQDAEIARQRVQTLAAQLEAETRGLRLYEEVILELQITRKTAQQSIERKQAIMSSRRRIPGEIWQKIFLLLWESEFEKRRKLLRPFSVALQVGSVCREWRSLTQTTTKLWSILDYTFSSTKRLKSRRDNKLNHYLEHIGAAVPYITLRSAYSLLLPTMLCQVTTAIELAINLEYPDLQPEIPLTFPPSTPIFSHLRTLCIESRDDVLQLMCDSLRHFPFLDELHLENMDLCWLPSDRHINLKTLYIEGRWEAPHHLTVDIAVIAVWFPNLTTLVLNCNLRISKPQVVFYHVNSLYVRNSVITGIRELASRVSFPVLKHFTNRGKEMGGLVPIVQIWGGRVETLKLSGIEPYERFSQHLLEIVGNGHTFPRLSSLALNGVGMIDLALVVDAIVTRNDVAANSSSQINRVETITLPITYNSDRNLERLKQHVVIEWQ